MSAIGGIVRRESHQLMAQGFRSVSPLPTIVFFFAMVLLHLFCAASPTTLASFSDGGPGMLLVSVSALLCLGLQAWAARRDLSRLWTVALPPALIFAAGAGGLALDMRSIRLTLGDPEIGPSMHLAVFREALGTALNIPVWACALGALSLAHAAWLLGSRARARHHRAPFKLPSAVALLAGVGFTIGLVHWASSQGSAFASARVFTLLLAVVAFIGLAIAATAVSARTDQESDRAAWGDGVGAVACAVASLALSAAAGYLHVHSRAHEVASGESLDASMLPTVMPEAAEAVVLELSLGALAAVACLCVGVLVLASRSDAAHARALAGGLGVVAVSLAPVGLLRLQLQALEKEIAEYRQPESGELVHARSIERGTLVVDLVPVADGINMGISAEVKLSDGQTERWNPGTVVRFYGVDSSRPVYVTVGTPYLARPAGPFVLGRSSGARVRLAVLRLAPSASSHSPEEFSEPERFLHVDVTDPSRTRLLWASARVVHAVKEHPAPIAQLRAQLQQQWQQSGSHRNDQDRKFDYAVVHYREPADIDSLSVAVRAIASTRRTLRGESVSAFEIFLQPASSLPEPQPGEEDALLERAAEALSPEESEAQARSALLRCQGSPCKLSSQQDIWGRELLTRCGRPLCSPATQALLWFQLGAALADRGDPAGAYNAFAKARALNPSLATSAAVSLLAAPERAPEVLLQAMRAPLPVVRLGAVTVNGRLPPAVIRSVMQTRTGPVRACYLEGLRRNPELIGRVAVRFVIDRLGSSAHHGNGGSDLPDPQTVACVVDALRGTVFPAPEGGIVTVVQPWMLQPR